MHMPGSIIADRYVLRDEVGHGGMGVVFRAYDVKLGRPVALKMVPSETPRIRVDTMITWPLKPVLLLRSIILELPPCMTSSRPRTKSL